MELGKQGARIIEYGITKTKNGDPQVFISFMVGMEIDKWYGMPYKKNGEVNKLCILQLAACGFDPATNEVKDLKGGLHSQLLITDEDIDIVVKDVLQGDGNAKRRIDSIGELGPMRIADDELGFLIPVEKEQKLKAVASEFKPRKKKVKEDPNIAIPF